MIKQRQNEKLNTVPRNPSTLLSNENPTQPSLLDNKSSGNDLRFVTALKDQTLLRTAELLRYIRGGDE